MPVKRRLSRQRTGWSAEHRQALEYHDWFGVFEDPFGRPDVYAMSQAWEALRDAILPEWIRQHPGTRPRGWWLFDMPEGFRRERIDGGQHPFDDPTYPFEHELFRGKPRFCREADRHAVYETQEAFLDRLQLLEPAERKALKLKDRR